jgi:crotonobetainyl-CoA:carnitine CoA-transferase CaiB-like acyl-CoA transferase
MADYAAGLVAALMIVAAVWHARHTGRGGDADLSLFESALAQLNYLATWTLSAGLEPVRRADSAHQSMVPFQAFAAADGWLVIAAPKQHLWEAAGRALGREDLLADRRFATSPGAANTVTPSSPSWPTRLLRRRWPRGSSGSHRRTCPARR